MSLHSQFKTDTVKEIEGVPVEYAPNKDGTVPTFYLSRIGRASKAYQKALEVATRPFRRQIDLGTFPESQAQKLHLELFLAHALKGWKDIQTHEGAQIAFSKETAKNLFAELPDLYEDLTAKAQSAAMFRDESLDEEAKN